MPLGYQPPKFQQFDGKGNPKQHIAHFVETCENANQEETSLSGNSRTVSMMELTNTKQRMGEPVISYINRWRALRTKPRTFEELATRAHDMELSIVRRGTKDFSVSEVRKDKKETKSAEKVVKSTMKESMVVNTAPLKFSKRKEGRPKKKDDGRKVDDPNYCKYHRVISHPVEKFFVLKELILRLACEKKIKLDLEEVAQTNHVAVTIMLEALSPRLVFEQSESLVQFGTFEPVVVQFHQEVAHGDSQEKERSIEEDDEGWILDENPGVVACHVINATEEESIPLRSLEEEGVSKDLARFNVDDLLSLSQETKIILINALLNSAASSSSAPTATYETVNIMSKSTMRQLGILMDGHSNSKLVIQGFNQSNQRVIGMIRLELIIGDLKASALFHVIDSRTTYKLLLDHPWIHGNGVVTSILLQCFKFYQDGVKKVEADSNPFSDVESHFVDVKFYLKNDNSPEAVPVEIPLVKR
ncbi:retrotransposon gag protein [Cucumis melo var. makuwa]|uniref:Retrotransposon gag protein n=1 Tax=Cucumis melo var. makuwa TaxID=1194695 RepID=A0A5D3D347_CUCMM|nr:retrotransposon gag protein [Cucumis melo var. makuwa]TYK18048.1 retrotransposon gag protein [Cucumis melo var. makuwa]